MPEAIIRNSRFCSSSRSTRDTSSAEETELFGAIVEYTQVSHMRLRSTDYVSGVDNQPFGSHNCG